MNRVKPPDTRRGVTKKGICGNFKFYVVINFYDTTHDPCEVFCQIAKQGTVVSGIVDAWVTTVSIALQYGVPWPVLKDKYTGHAFQPNDEKYSSIVDAIAQHIDEAVREHKSLWSDSQ